MNLVWVLFYCRYSSHLSVNTDDLYCKVNHCMWMLHLFWFGLYYAFFSLGILELCIKVLVSSNGIYLKIFLIEFGDLAYSLEGVQKHHLSCCLVL